jgi:hypothetical protein
LQFACWALLGLSVSGLSLRSKIFIAANTLEMPPAPSDPHIA